MLSFSSHLYLLAFFILFFFFNDTATTEIYTLSLHDALPISPRLGPDATGVGWVYEYALVDRSSTHTLADLRSLDRKSTRLNSSHSQISYAVFCLKKKKKKKRNSQPSQRTHINTTPSMPSRLS